MLEKSTVKSIYLWAAARRQPWLEPGGIRKTVRPFTSLNILPLLLEKKRLGGKTHPPSI